MSEKKKLPNYIMIDEDIAILTLNTAGQGTERYQVNVHKLNGQDCEVILYNETNKTRISPPSTIKIEEIARYLTSWRGTSITIPNDIRDLVVDQLESMDEIKKRIRQLQQYMMERWIPRRDELGSGSFPPPDFSKKMPLKLPLFGFVETETGSGFLTEGFWAVPLGKRDPFIYAYIGKRLYDLQEEDGKTIQIENMSRSLEAFLEPDTVEFKTEIQPPPYNEEWLIPLNVLENIDEEIDPELGKNVFKKLYSEIIPKHLLIPSIEERKTIAYWIMCSYFYDLFDAFPIGHGWGHYGSGKSRLGMLIVSIGYHGQFAINMTGPDLFRTKEEFKPTLVIDENEENLREVITIKDDLINGSYVRGGGFVTRRREVETDSGKIYVRDKYNLYSPAFFCSINPMRTPASRSRVITFPMVKRSVNVPICERKDYMDIQGNLYEMRLKLWNDIRKEYLKIRDTGIKDLDSRAFELWSPIFSMMSYLERWDDDFEEVMKFVEWNKQYKQDADMADEERPTLYASICKMIYEAKNGKTDNWFQHPNSNENLWEFEVGDLTIIMKQIANETGYTKPITASKVGSSLSMLALNKGKRGRTRRSTFTVDEEYFRNIVYDHMGVELETLGERDYDSKESLTNHATVKPKWMEGQEQPI